MLAAALALLAALPYLIGGVSESFVALDDDKYIYENPQVLRGLSAKTALWALRSTEAANWHPLTWLSHLLDVRLFGLDAAAHHAVGLGLHAANTLLLFLLLVRLSGAPWRSGLVAALFAVHPLHVESVAWASERKDLLSTALALLALLAWLRHLARPGAARLAGACALFALSLTAKPMTVTLPFVMLLLDWWPLGRWVPGTPSGPPGASPALLRLLPPPALWREKAPFFLLAAASSVVTFLVQSSGDAVSGSLSLWHRISNALASYLRYAGKTLWPAELAALYPFHEVPPLLAAAAALVLAGLTVAALRAARRRPWLAIGWLWYLGTLVPVIGLVQVGVQAMADRYTYLPLTGLFLILAWGLGDLAAGRPERQLSLGLLVTAALATLVAASSVQARYWKDSETLFRRTLAVTTDNWMIRSNLAGVLGKEGRHEEALAHASEAIRIQPGGAAGHVNRGFSLAALRRWEESVASYREALRLQPDAAVHASLGDALAASGKHAEAAARYREALRLGADGPGISYNLGNSLATLGRHEEAAASYRAALRLRPGHANAHANLGSALVALGRLEEAVASYRAALGIRPDPGDWYQLGLVLDGLGRSGEAAASLQKALLLRPDHGAARARLAQIQARGAIGPGPSSR